MSVIVLSYFGLNGRAGYLRAALTLTDVQWQNNVVAGADWPAMKANLPLKFSTLPLLEVDGKLLNQSYAILDYICTENKIGSTTAYERGLSTNILMNTENFMQTMSQAKYKEKDEEKKQQLLKELGTVHLPSLLDHVESVMVDQGRAYVVDDVINPCDIVLNVLISDLIDHGLVTLDNHPVYSKVHTQVRENDLAEFYSKYYFKP